MSTHNPMLQSKFMEKCTACGGNWGAMLLTGIKAVFPEYYEEVEKKYNSFEFYDGGVGAFMYLCDWLLQHEVYPDREFELYDYAASHGMTYEQLTHKVYDSMPTLEKNRYDNPDDAVVAYFVEWRELNDK